MFQDRIPRRFDVLASVTTNRVGTNAEYGTDDPFVDVGERAAQFVRLLAPLGDFTNQMFVKWRINCFFHKTLLRDRGRYIPSRIFNQNQSNRKSEALTAVLPDDMRIGASV